MNAIRHALREIGSHKFRSLLSMIGIILGVASLVAMVGVVQGMLSGFRDTFEKSGGIERLEIEQVEPPEAQKPFAHLSPGRTLNDYYALKAGLPGARRVSAEKNLNWTGVTHERRRHWGRLRGTTSETFHIERYELLPGGRTITDWDNDQKARVIVLNHQTATKLFGNPSDAVGKSVSVRNNVVFEVIGVMTPNETGEWHRGRTLFIPLTTALHYFSRFDDIGVDDLGVQAHRMEDIPLLTGQIERILLQTHNGIKDFEVRTRLEQLEEFQKMESSFVYSLGGVAAITLLVGGIGIANVMLAAISERIREIGIRKAVGANSLDIFIQFVTEAIVISVIGGAIGILASVGLVELLRGVLPEEGKVNLPLSAMLWGFLFSVIVGFCSGIYPAIKAARLPVIEALRYE